MQAAVCVKRKERKHFVKRNINNKKQTLAPEDPMNVFELTDTDLVQVQGGYGWSGDDCYNNEDNNSWFRSRHEEWWFHYQRESWWSRFSQDNWCDD